MWQVSLIIPQENCYLTPLYEDKLSEAGFVHIDIKSMGDDVYMPLHEYLSSNKTFFRKLHPLAMILAQLTMKRSADSVYAGLDYIISYAEKPCVFLTEGGETGSRRY